MKQIKIFVIKHWQKILLGLRDLIHPHNRIRLPLSRSFQETDVLMEEAILHLLDRFFQNEQPFHADACIPFSKKIVTVEEHRKLLAQVHGLDSNAYQVYSTLLDILDWYRTKGHHVSGVDVFMAAMKSGMSFDQAQSMQNHHNENVNSMLTFVLRHRDWLWT